jgi:putative oxidoreductase
MIRDLALFTARQAVGHGMAAHGAQKALGWFEGPGPENAAKMLDGLGFQPGATFSRLAAWSEIVSGEMIALGLGGPIGPALMVSNMIVAMRAVHWKNGFFAQKGGIELGLLYAAAALAFTYDFGNLSADQVLGLREKFKSPTLNALALAGAIAAAFVILEQRTVVPPDEPATPTYRGKNSPLPETPEPVAPAA